MTSLAYKQHLIFVTAALRQATRRWTPAVAVSCRLNGFHDSFAFTDFLHEFGSKHDAIAFGIELGKAWIEARI